jgi:uncharacterized protein with FMN-binding domain
MKRAILIATGTVGGLGAVLAITPPQFTATQSTSLAMTDAGTTTAPSEQAPAAATPTPGKTATTSKTKAPVPAVKTPAAAPAPAQKTKSVSGTFTGDSVDVRYGFVQVRITVENGKITDAQAVEAPSGRNDRWTQRAVPILRQQTLAAQSAQISGASGASFTSYGWYTSLASALAKAGL